jgi:hypothetical protein
MPEGVTVAKEMELDRESFEACAPVLSNARNLIAQAGSRVEAAGRIAHGYATHKLAPEESAVSYPIPLNLPSGSIAFAFMLYRYDVDLAARDYLLFAPSISVTVDVASLRPLAGC